MIVYQFLLLLGYMVHCGLCLVTSEMIEFGRMKTQSHFTLIGEANENTKHEIVIAVKQNNLDVIESMLIDRSTPGSENYQKWLSFDEVGSLITNQYAYDELKRWIETLPDATITWSSPRKEYIKVTATVKTWARAFNTAFFLWKDNSLPKEKSKTVTYIRAKRYFMPASLTEHIFMVYNVVQVPPPWRSTFHSKNGESSSYYKSVLRSRVLGSSNGATTVSFLNSYYEITTNKGNSTHSQSVFATSSNYYSANDLNTFQNYFGLPVQSAIDYNGHETSSCTDVDSCDEGNLDLQYFMGISQNTATIFYYVTDGTDPYLTWILDIVGSSNPPWVNSISYGTPELGLDGPSMLQFNYEAMKLGLIGVTIMVSSGDNGVTYYDDTTTDCYCNVDSSSSQAPWYHGQSWTGEGYFPSFPASSPYVTAVGATMGPNRGNTEVACESDLGGVITSGGGFSTFFNQSSWQKKAISKFFKSTGTPSPGYNSLGRGYPDVSLIGVQYEVVISQELTYLYGTSASSPVFAGFISILNAVRSREGKSSLGFINPTLYYAAYNDSSLFNDVTSGGNYCCENSNYPNTASICCKAGFNATTGWDPVTGWGSIDFTTLAAITGTTVPSASPSSASSYTMQMSTISFMIVTISTMMWYL